MKDTILMVICYMSLLIGPLAFSYSYIARHFFQRARKLRKENKKLLTKKP